MMRSAVSTSYSSTTSGGASRSALFPAPRSSRPFRNARSTSSCGTSGAGSRVARSFTNSTPIIRPRPRTSPMTAYFSCKRFAPASSRSPRRGTLGKSSRSTTSRVASAAAQHTGFPPHGARGLGVAEVAVVAIAVGHVVHLGEERREAGALDRLAGREAQPPVRAAVERARERDDGGASRRVPRELDRAFDRFGSRVRKGHTLLALARRELRQSPGKRGGGLEVKGACGDVEKPARRLLKSPGPLGVAVARGRHRDPGHEVQIAVPV